MKDIMFSIPYWKFVLKNWEQKKKKIHTLLEQYPCIKHEGQNFLTNRRLPLDSAAIFLDECLNLFSEPLNEFVGEVKTNLEISKAFATAYDKGHEQILHNHGKALFTAMIYVDLDPTDHSPTIYKQPFNQFDSANVCFLKLKTTEGDMIIVPSSIEHFSPVNNSSKRKTVIALDLIFGENLKNKLKKNRVLAND